MIKLKIFKNFSSTAILLFLLIGVSAFFRFYNLDWDGGNYFHPDERNIANAVTKIHFFSQLDPQFFAYGGFTIYLYRFAGDLLSLLTKDISWTTNWGNINIVGRIFSAFFSTLTIIPLYFLAKQLFDKKTALISAALFAFTVTSIQTAHYAVTESLITLIGVTISLFSILSYRKMRLFYTLILGILIGIGVASKTSALSFIIIPFLSYFISFVGEKKIKLTIILKHLFVFLLTGFLVFLIFSPYTFLNFNKFIESMKYESGVATGSLPVVYTLQFDHTISYLFQITNLFWQIGPLVFFSILGFTFIIFKAFKNRKEDKRLLIFIVSPLLYFMYIGLWHTKFIRYMMPMVPFLVISAAFLLNEISSKFKLLGNILIVITISVTIFWVIAFFSIYTKPQTRISASKWFYKNVPTNAKVLGEQWDDGLPIPIGSSSPTKYKITQLAMYKPDNEQKVNYLSFYLSNSDYIIFNSRRLYGTLINLSDKYPITSKYYKLLFEGKLGYEKVAEFTSYPSFLGLTINDDKSEETFQVYDHPKVMILKNTKHFSIEKFVSLL